MFDLLKEDEFSLTSFLVQQTVVPLVGFASILVSGAYRLFTPTWDNAWALLIAILIPFCVALIARQVAPRLSRNGRLIWIAPISLVILGLIHDSANFGFRSTVAEFFNPQMAEAAWVFVFLVIPTCACLAYSFGVSTKASASLTD
jgi:predicted Na+-dependent transporter